MNTHKVIDGGFPHTRAGYALYALAIARASTTPDNDAWAQKTLAKAL